MKSLILVSSLVSIAASVFGSVSFAGVREMATWTMDAGSVQAVLYDVLETAARLDSESRSPQGQIVRKLNALIVENETASLVCEAKTLGMAMVMSYRCSLKGNISAWTNDAGSVQAILFDSLETALNEDEQSRYPSKAITRKNASLIVSDNKTVVSCQAGTQGVAQVQNYACTVK